MRTAGVADRRRRAPSRRAVLRGVVGLAVWRVTPTGASAQSAAGTPTVVFERCDVAVVTNASSVDRLTVYYARRYGERAVRYDVPAAATDTDAHRPILVRYVPTRDRTQVTLAARGSLVRIVAETDAGERVVARTTDVAGCPPDAYNAAPAASAVAATATRTASDGETLVAYAGEPVTFSSTATDPDSPAERLRYEWYLDDSGGPSTGASVTTAYAAVGRVVVRHCVVDDFDVATETTLAVQVRRPWRLRAKLAPEGVGPGDQFGTDVVVSGDTIVASAPGDDERGSNAGAVYVYDRTDLVAPPTKLTPAALHSGDLGGISIAVAGETLALSAVCDDERGDDAGAVYLYDLGSLSAPPTKLAPPSLRRRDFLGLSMAAVDETLVVGAHLDDERADWAGSVFVFDLADSDAAPRKLLPAALGERDLFGISVAVTDGAIVGGAVGDDDAGAQAGVVYVYDRADPSTPPTALRPDGLGRADQFGRPLAARGGTLVVGTPFDDDGGPQMGAVYQYRLDALDAAPRKLRPEGLAQWDLFGYAVAISAATVAVGAIGDDERAPDAGAVYTYDRTDLSAPPEKLAPAELLAGDLFGYAVDVAADTLVVGAIFDDERGDDAGAVYVFER